MFEIGDKVEINNDFTHTGCPIDSLHDILDNGELDFSKVDPMDIIGMTGIVMFVSVYFVRIKLDKPFFNLKEYCFDYEELTKIEKINDRN